MERTLFLDEVKEIITKGRVDAHGNQESCFGDIADAWSMYLDRKVTSSDVAMMMILLKVARYKNGQHMLDHWIDIAGYAANGAELDTQEADNG